MQDAKTPISNSIPPRNRRVPPFRVSATPEPRIFRSGIISDSPPGTPISLPHAVRAVVQIRAHGLAAARSLISNRVFLRHSSEPSVGTWPRICELKVTRICRVSRKWVSLVRQTSHDDHPFPDSVLSQRSAYNLLQTQGEARLMFHAFAWVPHVM